MEKKRKTAAAALAIAAALPLTAFADGAAGPATDVWIDVVKEPTQDRICVTVPLAYGFAVVGSSNETDGTPISVENGTLLLPNVRVEKREVVQEGTEEYYLSFTGSPELPVKNYSTTVPEGEEEETAGRTGLAVNLTACMEARDAEGVQPPGAGERWTMTPKKPSTESGDAKKYRLGLGSYTFSQAEDGKPAEEGKAAYWLNGEIYMAAPENVETNGWTAAGTANKPSVTSLPVNIEVGGVQRDYTKAEESIKVGTIRWTVEAADQEQETE